MTVAPSAAPPRPGPESSKSTDSNQTAIRGRSWRRFGSLPEVRWAAASLCFFIVAAICHVAGAPAGVEWPAWILCYLTGGWEPALAGLRAARDKTLDVDLLMVVAAIVAASIGQVVDGGLLIIIFSTSGALEAVATRQTQDSVRSLLDLTPERATVLTPSVEGEPREVVVAASELGVGDLIVVRPGELIAADGEVVFGVSEVDQSSVTGEHLAVTKRPTDKVFSGTMNTAGVLHVRVERPAGESVVARIVSLVEEASATKAERQLWIEHIEQRYSVLVVVATVAFIVIPLLVTDWSFQKTLIRAMTFMIVASPCAVVLATMPPLLSAVANAGRHAILVKSTVVMEQIARIDTVVLDKTGTVTQGRPRMASVSVAPGGTLRADEVISLAAGVETWSEHPLGAAVVGAANSRSLRIPAAVDFEASPGRGVRASIDGSRIEVLSPAAASAEGAQEAWCEEAVAASESGGGTAVVVMRDRFAIGVIALQDTVRDDAAEAVASLGRILGHPAVLLTGDNRRAAMHVAAQVGISDVHADLLPADKVERVRQLQASGHSVMVVGDGVNDAPALAAADLGIAMGQSGSDVTLQAADGVILRDQLSSLPSLVYLARRARRMVLQNLVFAVVVIVSLVTLDLLGHLPLPLGVAGHEGSTVVIGLNGLRLLRSRAWSAKP